MNYSVIINARKIQGPRAVLVEPSHVLGSPRIRLADVSIAIVSAMFKATTALTCRSVC